MEAGPWQFWPCSARLRPAKRPYTAKHGWAVSYRRAALHNQSGGVCNAKYPQSWIVNIAAQMISIRIKARVLNLIPPPQSARIVALGEALMRRLPHFETLTSLFLRLLPRDHSLTHRLAFGQHSFSMGQNARTLVLALPPKGQRRASSKGRIQEQRDQFA